MFDVRHVTVSVERPWQDAYDVIWRPEWFPTWASGLSQADLRLEADTWVATGPDGPIRIEFTGHNAFGVMDHTVPNDAGAEIIITVFRYPGMSDEIYVRDVAWVERDLASLKRLLEAEGGASGDKPYEAAQPATE